MDKTNERTKSIDHFRLDRKKIPLMMKGVLAHYKNKDYISCLYAGYYIHITFTTIGGSGM